jgi:hypothetical protein
LAPTDHQPPTQHIGNLAASALMGRGAFATHEAIPDADTGYLPESIKLRRRRARGLVGGPAQHLGIRVRRSR